MTKEEALKVLVKMRAWRRWGKGEQNEEDRPEMPEQKEVDKAFDVCIEMLSQPSLPSNLDEAAREYAGVNYDCETETDAFYNHIEIDAFKAGAEWMAGQGETHELTVESPVLGPPMICCSVHADKGDKVVVQIRKK